MVDTQKSLVDYFWSALVNSDSLKAAMGGEVRCYFTWANPDAVFPYLVHRINITPSDPFPMRQATYYLDIWSDSPNADEVLTVRTLIIALLDELTFSTNEANSVRVALQTEGFVPEPEQGIWHYAMQWTLRYYRKAEAAAIISR